MPPRDLGPIFKAYDVRGVVPDELDEDAARRIGAAFAQWAGEPGIAVGRHCRVCSPGLAEALIEGAASRAVDVGGVGLVSTDPPDFVSGGLRVPGLSTTVTDIPA